VLFAGLLATTGCGGGGSAAACGAGPSCGGDGGPGDAGPVTACGKVQPCGGDVIGQWTFTDVCQGLEHEAAVAATFAERAADSWCVGQTLVGQDPAVSGSYAFDTDGNYTLMLVVGGTIDINLPTSCLAGLTCDDTTVGLQAQIDDGSYPMPHVTAIACSGSSSCVCRATIDSPRPESGTYTLSGNVLSLTPSGGTTRNQSYCVAGKTLHLLDTSMPTAGSTVIDTDYVANKY
jgi:hypothetical protein